MRDKLAARETLLYNYSGLTPLIFIGLGSCGREAVKRISHFCTTRDNQAGTSSICRFFSIDSQLPEPEEEAIPCINILEGVEESLADKSSPLHGWLPEGSAGASLPPDLTRVHYRMGFTFHRDRIREELEHAIRETMSEKNEFQEERNCIVDEGLTIYIISSLSEKSATGVLWDMSNLARRESSGVQGPVRIIGMCVIPDVSGEKEQNEDDIALSYAVMKEMKSLVRSKELPGPKEEKEKPQLEGNPFDCLYFLPADMTEEATWIERVIEPLVQYVSLELDPFFSPKLKRSRDQLSMYLDSPVFTFGVAEIMFPYEEIIDWCSKKLVSRTLEKWGREDTTPSHDESLRRFYKIMEIKNPEKAGEEFIKKMGKPKETAWHIGRQLRELHDTYKKQELIDKLEDEYRRLGAEEVTESSRAYNLRIKELASTHKSQISKTLMDMASDSNLGLSRLKNIVTSFNSFLARTQKEIEKKIEHSALKIDELDRQRLAQVKTMRKLVKSPLFFLNKGKLSALYEENWKICEHSFEERLTVHILTSALEYFHHLKEHVFHYREPVDSLIEVHEFIGEQLEEGRAFSLPPCTMSLSFIDENTIDEIYEQFIGSEERTISGVISNLLSLIPLDLMDLSNKRVLRDLKNGACEALYTKAHQCFESMVEKPMIEFFHEMASPETQKSLMEKLFALSAPPGGPFIDDEATTRKLHLIGFYEGSCPQRDASMSIVQRFNDSGIDASHIMDLQNENRIVSLIQYSGLSLDHLLGLEVWRKGYMELIRRKHLHITRDQSAFARQEEASALQGSATR